MNRLIRFDWAIKHILRNPANFDVLEGFLSELLKEEIHVKAILESESNQESKEDKFNRVDLLVQASDEKEILIEVQCTSEWDYLSRILYGTSKTVTQHLKIGSPYLHIKKVISISIVFFNLGEGQDYIYKGTTDFRGVHLQDRLCLGENEKQTYAAGYQFPSDIFPEYYILRVNQYRETIRDKFDEWMYFLKTEQIRPGFSAKGLQSAYGKLDVLKLSAEEREAYERYQDTLHYEASMVESHYRRGERIGREEGKAEGLQEGKEQGALEIAQALLKQGVDRKAIQAATGLSVEQLERLRT